MLHFLTIDIQSFPYHYYITFPIIIICIHLYYYCTVYSIRFIK